MASSIIEKFQTMDYGPALEDTAEVTRWLDAHHRTFGHYIDGAFTTPASQTFTTTNPATGEPLATIAAGTAADVDAAVAAATNTLPAWQALTGHQRARYLYALARQVQKHSRRLAVLENDVLGVQFADAGVDAERRCRSRVRLCRRFGGAVRSRHLLRMDAGPPLKRFHADWNRVLIVMAAPVPAILVADTRTA